MNEIVNRPLLIFKIVKLEQAIGAGRRETIVIVTEEAIAGKRRPRQSCSDFEAARVGLRHRQIDGNLLDRQRFGESHQLIAAHLRELPTANPPSQPHVIGAVNLTEGTGASTRSPQADGRASTSCVGPCARFTLYHSD